MCVFFIRACIQGVQYTISSFASIAHFPFRINKLNRSKWHLLFIFDCFVHSTISSSIATQAMRCLPPMPLRGNVTD